MTNNLHYPDVMDAQCSKKVLSCRRVFFRSRSPAISRELTTLFSLESQDLMMSVFCSNTPVFAPRCLKCIERGPDFKIFPETRAFGVRKSRLCRKVFPSPLGGTHFCHLLKILLKTLGQVDFTCWASNFVNSLVQLSGD